MSVPSLALTLILALGVAPAVSAQPAEGPPPTIEPPPLPPRVQSGEVLEPDVRIIQREREVITEYRQAGQLYAIKVVPRIGPVYWLVDGDGDGRLETRYHELAPGILIPSWVLFTW